MPAAEETTWISPIGRSVADDIAEEERRNPESMRLWEESRPCRELSKASVIRRTELGISQRELARRMGIGRSVIWRLERGERNFSEQTMRKLAPLIQL